MSQADADPSRRAVGPIIYSPPRKAGQIVPAFGDLHPRVLVANDYDQAEALAKEIIVRNPTRIGFDTESTVEHKDYGRRVSLIQIYVPRVDTSWQVPSRPLSAFSPPWKPKECCSVTGCSSEPCLDAEGAGGESNDEERGKKRGDGEEEEDEERRWKGKRVGRNSGVRKDGERVSTLLNEPGPSASSYQVERGDSTHQLGLGNKAREEIGRETPTEMGTLDVVADSAPPGYTHSPDCVRLMSAKSEPWYPPRRKSTPKLPHRSAPTPNGMEATDRSDAPVVTASVPSPTCGPLEGFIAGGSGHLRDGCADDDDGGGEEGGEKEGEGCEGSDGRDSGKEWAAGGSAVLYGIGEPRVSIAKRERKGERKREEEDVATSDKVKQEDAKGSEGEEGGIQRDCACGEGEKRHVAGQASGDVRRRQQTEGDFYIFRISSIYPPSAKKAARRRGNGTIPPSLREIIENPKLAKMGAALRDDARLLRKGYSTRMRGWVDAQDMARERGMPLSLERLAVGLGIPVGNKAAVRAIMPYINWDAHPLEDWKTEYAAWDSYLSYAVTAILLDDQKSEGISGRRARRERDVRWGDEGEGGGGEE